jgi:hypothetical protein
MTEFRSHQLGEAAEFALTNDLAVVRRLIDPGEARAIAIYAPKHGRRAVFLNPGLAHVQPIFDIELINDQRHDVRKVLGHHFGWAGLALNPHVMKPEALQSGPTQPHLDRKTTLLMGLINLSDSQEVVFRAHRVGTKDGAYSKTVDYLRDGAINRQQMTSCQLGTGDMVLIGRGTVHELEAPQGSQSIIYSSRAFISPDFQTPS